MAKPTKYESHIAPRLSEIKVWREERLSIPDIAKRLSVGLSTLNQYRAYYPELEEALQLLELPEISSNSRRNHEKWLASSLSFIKKHMTQTERQQVFKAILESIDDEEVIEEFRLRLDERKKQISDDN
ncbi:hypothetical protein GHI93_00310 [Lactococcus hircilactis]|uniref:Transposase n=1 Tax=Lactococcus hircilactis TaxID=1494462 RepID=A0A7X2CZR0_9LACT|nr:hypothetical protein [Lactococcus hircilactis]MQW38393.1 hypothetical protein [Lactococcus hircilactis]